MIKMLRCAFQLFLKLICRSGSPCNEFGCHHLVIRSKKLNRLTGKKNHSRIPKRAEDTGQMAAPKEKRGSEQTGPGQSKQTPKW